jgi:hypothetical protein
MKKLGFLTLLALLLTQFQLQAQTARLQVIHNCADLAAEKVDVYLNDSLLLDDFAFRTATPFIDAPAGADFDVSICAPSSTDSSGALFRKTFNLTAGDKYVVIANGIVSPTGYTPVQPFDLHVIANAREASAGGMMETDLVVWHGATDAPAVDAVEVGAGAGTLVDNLPYASASAYLELPTADYSIQVRTQDNTTAAQYDAPLATLALGGGAGVVLASGFLDPVANSGGPAFGLFVALPTGGSLVPLPSAAISTSRLQVIHNCADLAAATVDVYLNDGILLDDFAFRKATPFIDAPAGTAFDVSICLPTSTDTVGALFKKTFTLTGGEKYIVIANGTVSASGYTPVQPFDLTAFAGARESAETGGNTSVLVYHGSTDAPTVDVVETAVPAGTVVDNISYNEFDGYLDVPAVDLTLDIRDMMGSTTVASYSAPLGTLGLADAAITVLASGFLNPLVNSNGPAFGLWVALSSGGSLVELPLAVNVDDAIVNQLEVPVYPNPANSQLTFALEGKGTVELVDLQGRVLRTADLQGTTTLDIADLPGGIYLARISNGQATATQRVVIARN